MFKKLNNKGNTLGIVLVGICILSILGTLILGVTSTNYNMKLNDKKTEMVFYHTEKAVDEIYTVIGNDVMKCAKDAYTEVLSMAVKEEGGVYKEQEEHSKLFKDKYVEKIKNLYKEDLTGNTNLNAIITYLDGEITPVSGYDISVKTIADPDTKITHLTDATTSEFTGISIANVCVECVSNVTKNRVSIVTDFTVKVPNVVLNFDDSKTEGEMKLEDFCTFALIAQGDVAGPLTGVKPSTLTIDGNDALIKGNIYLGGNQYIDNSLLASNEANLTCLSQVIYCEKKTVLKEANVELRSIAQTSSIDADQQYNTKDTLQFFTNNISTEPGTTDYSGYPNFSISGNCIVQDDLEINADDTKMKFYGNYFGYGFRKLNDWNWTEKDSSTFDISEFVPSGFSGVEHKESSAIIVNAKNANLDFTGLQKLLLAGRAYIDLDENGGVNTSYMTGESVSYKGNQVLYQADAAELNGLSNGIAKTELEDLCGGSGSTITSAKLGISDNIIGKENGTAVYFYKKQDNPVEQSEYYKNVMTDASYSSKANLYKEKVKNLNSTVKFSNTLSRYTVGAVVETNAGTITTSGEAGFSCGTKGTPGILSTDSTVSGSLGFSNIIKDIYTRKGHMVPLLHNVDSSDLNSYLGNDVCTETASVTGKTPIQLYLKSSFLDGTDSKEIKTLVTDTTIRDQISAFLGGVDITGKKVGYAIINSSTVTEVSLSDASAVNYDIGVIVTTKPVKVSKDFIGMIITKDTVSIHGDIDITANKDIAELMFKIDELKDIINSEYAGGDTEVEDYDVVNVNDGFSYEKLVEKSNWRKNLK